MINAIKERLEIMQQESSEENVTQVYGIRCKAKGEKIQDWDYDSLTNICLLYTSDAADE